MHDDGEKAPQRARYGVVLAGGDGTRMGGRKPHALLAGRTLLEHAVQKVRDAGLEPVVCARIGTELPDLGVKVIREAEAAAAPHPLAGVAEALEVLGEAAVLLPVDLPLLPAEVLVALATGEDPLRLIATAAADGVLHHAALVLRAGPQHAPALRRAAGQGAGSMRTLAELGATPVDLATVTDVPAETALKNVNDADDLAGAEQLLSR